MPYTEIKLRNDRKYSYRVISVRQGEKVKKKRIYLGSDLPYHDLKEKEISADLKFKTAKIDEALKPIKKKIISILKKSKVKKAGVFGSYARGEQGKDSDVDILIEPPKGIGFGLFKISSEFEEALGKKVDLVTYNGLNHLLRKRILAEEKVLYG